MHDVKIMEADLETVSKMKHGTIDDRLTEEFVTGAKLLANYAQRIATTDPQRMRIGTIFLMHLAYETIGDQPGYNLAFAKIMELSVRFMGDYYTGGVSTKLQSYRKEFGDLAQELEGVELPRTIQVPIQQPYVLKPKLQSVVRHFSRNPTEIPNNSLGLPDLGLELYLAVAGLLDRARVRDENAIISPPDPIKDSMKTLIIADMFDGGRLAPTLQHFREFGEARAITLAEPTFPFPISIPFLSNERKWVMGTISSSSTDPRFYSLTKLEDLVPMPGTASMN